ncbi:30S ribosomal protein S20 [Patescibacteria group bacterium]|nr:30S ribosomal protein S20 [Patescibacteria group bacterium]
MPIIKSAKKALRQSKKRRKFNLVKKEKIRDIIKKIKRLKTQGKNEEAEKLLPLAYKAFDKAAKTGVIKKQASSRKKSRLVKFLRK